jgi:glycerol-3-phosphate dehydrogenase (NAD(P)+)
MIKPIAILGAGAWGTALAIHLGRHNQPVHLWGGNLKKMKEIQSTRYNSTYLPYHKLPPSIVCTADLTEAISQADTILMVVPSHQFRKVLKDIKPHLKDIMHLVWATKGLESEQTQLLPYVVETELNREDYAILSGPSFANEVAQGLPTAVTLASKSDRVARQLQERFHYPEFHVYISHDVIGVSLGGTMKNVLAIAVGVADGLGLGANTRSALMTRGLSEMQRLGKAIGANPITFTGLSGVGDLSLTCMDNQSRNRRLGLALGKGETLSRAQTQLGLLSEGVSNTKSILELAKKHKTSLPICEMVYAILYEGLNPTIAVHNLLEKGAAYEIE